ncbi:terminase small subunit [[Clostridium] innocuum]|nr:terminase small subunit [[Clostridium] innocuum]
MEKDNKASDAYKDYRKGMKYKDIADKYNVSLNTVKSWKRRQWADIEKGVQPKKKSVHTKRIPKESSNAPPKEELLPEEIETLNNEELTERQRLFCLYYVRWFNATKAYQKAYSCDYFTAAANGPRLLGNARIKEEIQRIKDAKIKQTMYSTEDYFQKMIDIAYSDVTDYLSFGQEEAQDKNGNTFMMNVINLKESCDVDGTLIQEVKQGKDGIAVKLVSKEFALKWLDKHYSEATDLQKAQIEQLRAQTDKLTIAKGDDEQLSKVDKILEEMQRDAERKAG